MSAALRILRRSNGTKTYLRISGERPKLSRSYEIQPFLSKLTNQSFHSSSSNFRGEDYKQNRSGFSRKPFEFLKNGNNRIVRRQETEMKEFNEIEEKPIKKSILTNEWQGKKLSDEEMEKVKHFNRLGINSDLSKQIIKSFSHIQKPTLTQALYLKAVRKPSDIILRSHTSSGKSLAGLISMMNKYPFLFEEVKEEIGKDSSKKQRTRKIESIIVVPSRELALQYGHWASKLIPKSMHEVMDSIVDVRYYTKSITSEEHMKNLYHSRPRILVITAKLLNELLQDKDAERFLIRNLNTLLLDEVDALFELPGKFPNKKQIWQHSKHPPPTIQIMEKIMKIRKTYSSGKSILMSGLESEVQLNKIPNSVKEKAISGTKRIERKENSENLRSGIDEESTLNPIQFIVMSATANAVLRHYLGARTGWLRTGLRDSFTKIERGKWLDMTGLSQGVKKADELKDVKVLPFGMNYPIQLPQEIDHYCVVVDQVPDDRQIGQHPSLSWRNLKVQNKPIKELEEGVVVEEEDNTFITNKQSVSSKEALKIPMLTCLAYMFATHRIQKGLLVIPDTFSSTQTITFLKEVGVPVKTLSEFQNSQGPSFNKVSSTPINSDHKTSQNVPKGEEEDFLLVVNKSSIRGLDIPGGITHTFILGMDAIGEPAVYTHIAGRVSRLGNHFSPTKTENEQQQINPFNQRPSGSVITILCGLSEEESKIDVRYISEKNDDDKEAFSPFQISSEERKMISIYKQLSLPVQKMTKLKPRTVKQKEDNQKLYKDESISTNTNTTLQTPTS